MATAAPSSPSSSLLFKAAVGATALTAAVALLKAARLVGSSRWYCQESERYFAIKHPSPLLISPSQIPNALWSTLTCWARTLPDVYLLGATKGGSTSLYSWLLQTPAIVGSHLAKESHFFSGRSYLRAVFSRQWDRLVYRSFFPLYINRLFAALRGKPYLVLEATPMIRYPQLAKRLAAVTPTAKGIVVLRDPIQRAYSHFRMLKTHFPERESRTFNQAVKDELLCEHDDEDAYIDIMTRVEQSFEMLYDGRIEQDRAYRFLDKRYLNEGLYAEHLDKYTAAFGADRILVIGFNDLVARPEETMKITLAFLGLPPSMASRIDFKPVNEHSGLANTHRENNYLDPGVLEPETLSAVQDFFKDSNARVLQNYNIDLVEQPPPKMVEQPPPAEV